jgi:A/G-specific adenine glycosylase
LRRPLPWIAHPDPWAILVSEVMLQQTQSARVIEPWSRFLEEFPSPRSCADAPLSQVLRLWDGLGYPRRARALHLAARQIRDEHAGVVPSEFVQIRQLAGVGDYTASAVASFAFHHPVAVVDTNVGRVLARAVMNRTLKPNEARVVAQDLLPRGDSTLFNQAMIDLGAQYCRSVAACSTCPLRRTCRWQLEGGDDPAPHSAGVSRPQSKFAGSNRQVRGRILRELGGGARTASQLRGRLTDIESSRYEAVLRSLEVDGLIEVRDTVRLVGD